MTGHIQIEVLGAEGAMVTAMDVPFEPARIPSGTRPQARFAARLAEPLPPGAVIIVRHCGDQGVRRFRETPAGAR